MQTKERFLIASAYLFGVPALYIILTEYRKKKYIGFHGAQALMLWIVYFAMFFTVRFGLNLLLAIRYFPPAEMVEPAISIAMGGYALACGIRAFMGKDFKLPR